MNSGDIANIFWGALEEALEQAWEPLVEFAIQERNNSAIPELSKFIVIYDAIGNFGGFYCKNRHCFVLNIGDLPGHTCPE